MPISSPLTQGGQTLVHKIRMLRQILKFALVCATILSGCYFGIRMAKVPAPILEKSAVYFQAKIMHMVNSSSRINVGEKKVPTKVILLRYHPEVDLLKKEISLFLKELALVFPSSFGGILLIFWLRGKRDRRNRHHSGQECVHPKKLKKQLQKEKKCSNLSLGSLPIVKGSETQHFLITGTTGTGKTNCLHHLLPQIRQQKQKAVLVDTTGIFVQHYFREGVDILLNPFDQRSHPWKPWEECIEPYHYKEVAKSLIPQTSQDPFWSTSAQTVFSIILEHLNRIGERSTRRLLKMLLEDPLEELFAELSQNFSSDVRALSLLDPKSEKTATSIRSSAANYIECLAYLADTDRSFSIRKWIQDDSQSQWLFLTMLPEQRDTLRPLISMWASIAIKSLLGKTPSEDSRTWFVFDELASLHQLNDLTTCLAESRKYGGAVVLGLQNLGQLDEIYGVNTSKALVDLCSTKVCFRQTSPDLAYRMSKAFGEKEVVEMQEGISYGANDVRDGVSLSMLKREKATVSPTDIFALPNLEAYIKLAGNYPVTKLAFSYNEPKKLSALPFLKKMAPS